MEQSRFNTDITPLYNAVRDFIKEHQGEKGYINVQDKSKDTIYAVAYEDLDYYTLCEGRVKAIRVKDDEIEIIYENEPYYINTVWTDEDIRDADENDWELVLGSEKVFCTQTLYSIAENIDEYV